MAVVHSWHSIDGKFVLRHHGKADRMTRYPISMLLSPISILSSPISILSSPVSIVSSPIS